MVEPLMIKEITPEEVPVRMAMLRTDGQEAKNTCPMDRGSLRDCQTGAGQTENQRNRKNSL